jgi:hypothetical protein
MRSYRKFLLRGGVALCAALGWLAVAQAAETKGPVTDEIGVLVIPKGAPIQIGGYWVLSGPDTALGLDQKRAVEIAVKEKGKLVGHPIKFSAEDSLCNAEGGQTAATKLARGDPGRADPLESGHHQHRHLADRAQADRREPRTRL